ncbi:MAG: amino acid ABC transporter ATP-binding protein [Actinomycetota bacterium]
MSPTEPARAHQRRRGGDTLLEIRGLSKSFGDHEVLRSIDLTLERGKVLVLIGPSGSGKTTVLRSINGLDSPNGGELAFSGGPRVNFAGPISTAERSALRDRSAMVFQHYNLFPHKTVLQNVTEGPLIVQRRPRDEVEAEAVALLDRVGLADKRDSRPFELSGGQQQRVGIVRALALRPQLLLFDEPTSSLDPELVGEVLAVIKELAEDGWTMIVVTHELVFARQVADEVLFLDGGVIVERGAPSRLLRAPQEERTKRFLQRLLHPL